MSQAKLVLYADDDEDDRFCLQEAWLSHTGYELRLFESGVELITFLGTNPSPDVCFIILDQNMPQFTGIESLERIRQMKAFEHTPVVLYSTNVQAGNFTQAQSTLKVHLVQKPNSMAEINAVADRIIKLCGS
ncbi:response regulator [Flaviaesturariibacter amylovorans]|uniref:Response regulatory domain-containing protein n=1 Tax=Flaviaesturariibacter amylovorans TaxID=1084520 RepID=A0ABP8H565_9BACT